MAGEPHETIWMLTTALVASRSLHVVAELGVADHIEDDPVPLEVLAAACSADAEGLDRVLRLLAANGVFMRAGERYAHTEASQLLRSDHPRSMRAFPRMMGMPVFTAAFGQLGWAVTSGRPAVEQVDPNGLWAYLDHKPDEAAVFGQAMTAKAAADVGHVLGAYDFRPFRTIADIGGGYGHLLRAVLDSAPTAEGILFDLPAVIDAVPLGPDRLTLRPGDFFEDPLPSADLYILMEVIHDWADPEAGAILTAIRRAAPAGAKVLIIECLIPEDHAEPRVHTLDVIMLAITGGRERTVAQLDALLHRAGFEVGRVIETPGPLRIVEAEVV